MKDFYKEQLVKKIYDKKDKSQKIYILVGAAFIILILWELIISVAQLRPEYALSLWILIPIFAALIILLALRLISNLNKEFEYCYTEGNLDIDVIINKKRRKRVFSGYVEEFEVVAPINDGQHLAMYDSLKEKDFSSGSRGSSTYAFVAVYKGKKRKFVFEPCDEIIKAMRTDLSPRRMFVNNYK